MKGMGKESVMPGWCLHGKSQEKVEDGEGERKGERGRWNDTNTFSYSDTVGI